VQQSAGKRGAKPLESRASIAFGMFAVDHYSIGHFFDNSLGYCHRSIIQGLVKGSIEVFINGQKEKCLKRHSIGPIAVVFSTPHETIDAMNQLAFSHVR
jgi:uncharacterized protein YheU (UPF0270 family)